MGPTRPPAVSGGAGGEPWALPLADRLALLRPGTIRVGYFYEVPESGSFRYRAYNMAQTLNSYSEEFSGSYFFLSDIPLIENFADWLDILVLVRFRYSGGVGRLIDAFRARDKPVLFDIDDLIVDPTHTPLLAATLNFGLEPGLVLDNWYALTSRLGHTLSLCDATITTTPTLAEQTHLLCGTPSFVIPNFLNHEQLAASAPVHPVEPRAGNTLRIGYFSGSTSHALDFAVALHGIEEFLVSNPGARLVVAGILDLPDSLASLGAQITRLPFMDYVSLQAAIAGVDVNIVPLQQNLFTDCKSELKYFESAAVGTATMASPTEVFSRVIVPGTTGWLAHADEWSHALSQVATLEGEQIVSVARAAKEHALATYTGQALLGTIESTLEQVAR